jgi:hypothetical protein
MIEQFPKSNLTFISTLALFMIFVGCILGMYIGMIYADRGDMVTKKDECENELSEEELEELNRLVNVVNK